MTVKLYQVREGLFRACGINVRLCVREGSSCSWLWGSLSSWRQEGGLSGCASNMWPQARLRACGIYQEKWEMVLSFHSVIWKLHTACHCQVNLFSVQWTAQSPLSVAKCTKSSKAFCHNCHQQRCRNFRAELSCSRTCSREGILAAQTQQRKKWFHSERRFLLFIESGKCVTGSSEVMEGSNLEGSNLYTQWETEVIEEIPPHPYPSPKPIFCRRKDHLSDTGQALVFFSKKSRKL